jgi:AcrR family transcriptional regulator
MVKPSSEVDGAAAPRRRRSRRGEGPRLSDEILEATEALLLRTGSAEAVSIDAIAAAVGVTPPSIYRHFADKQTLMYAVSERHFRTLDALVEQAVAGLGDPVEALAAAGRAYIAFGTAHPEPYRILFLTHREMTPEAVQAEWASGPPPSFLRFVALVQACIDAGRLRPGLTDALQVALGLFARFHGLTSLMVSRPFLPFGEGFADDYVETSLRGVVAG